MSETQVEKFASFYLIRIYWLAIHLQAVSINLAAIYQRISFSFDCWPLSNTGSFIPTTHHTLHNNYVVISMSVTMKATEWLQKGYCGQRAERVQIDLSGKESEGLIQMQSPCRWFDKMLRSSVGELLKGMELLQTLRASWASGLSQTVEVPDCGGKVQTD